ncbi:flagellar basal body-associated FliL family protein [Alkaliphilus peptidifermentans]|uniref:Flagellar protein FliL n=1 Tax=Alkaliphilus peptidifermentans DSM 18978 TaxID=1120976 RepID=A0A1G5DHB9_9FIRM|nr:flagellar basal body-associated FliL family protein [Alkaliphilus peptidifermentans]SCY13947.1 flagellar FliL protein [Alkaliphilus peptidifermentans DSM 18978]
MNTKKIILYGIIGFLLSGVFFGSAFYFLVMRNNTNAVQSVKTYEYPLGDFTANLSNVRTYFKSSIVVETTNKKLIDTFQEKNAEIRDQIIKNLITKKPDELLTAEGQENLRTEIKVIISKIVEADEITNIYFIDYIIQ